MMDTVEVRERADRLRKRTLAQTAMFDAATVLLLTLHEGVRLLIDAGKEELKRNRDR